MSTAAKLKMMESYSFDEVITLVRQFEQCTLPRAQWTHQANLMVAFWYLVCYSATEAVERIREGIKKYNASQGILATKSGGYHETMTLFWIKMVQCFLAKNTLESSITHLVNSMTALYADKNLPFEYYSRELLMSWEARTIWIEPDLKSLPTKKEG